jgi:hypothetical protein
MNTLSEQQLEKLNTKRLVEIRKRLTPELKRWQGRPDVDPEYYQGLVNYDAALRKVMSTREHVERKH